MSAGRPEGGLAARVTEMNARKGQDMRAEHTGRLLRGMVSLASGMLLATGALGADGGLGLKVDSLRVEVGGFTDHPRASGDAFAIQLAMELRAPMATGDPEIIAVHARLGLTLIQIP